jgi:hypothetical protein
VQKLKRQIRVIRFFSRFLSAGLSAFMTGSMAYSLQSYLHTRDIPVYGFSSIWAQPTVLWPTIMLLTVSFTSFVINFSIVCSYCCSSGVKTANNIDKHGTRFAILALVVEVIVWAVTTGLYRMANTGHDLWGWSCGPTSDEIQPLVQSFLDFGKLCTVQVSDSRPSGLARGSNGLTDWKLRDVDCPVRGLPACRHYLPVCV